MVLGVSTVLTPVGGIRSYGGGFPQERLSLYFRDSHDKDGMVCHERNFSCCENKCDEKKVLETSKSRALTAWMHPCLS